MRTSEPGAGRPTAPDPLGSRGEEGTRPGADEPVIDVGVLVAHSPGADLEALGSLAEETARRAAGELTEVTAASWRVHRTEADRLGDGTGRHPSAFLDEAFVRMVEGPYDVVVVLTDVPLVSRRDRLVPGLASPIARIVVLSTRTLLVGARDQPRRSLSADAVGWNAATLLLHLFGHVLGARHGDGGVMEPFEFDPSRRRLPNFEADVGSHLRRIADRVPEEAVERGPLRRLGFHVLSVIRNPRQVAGVLWHSRAPLLPLSLPALATAAVAPTLILVFSAETWDVGLNLDNLTATLFAATSVLAAAIQLVFVQNLTFPRERRRVLTEHVALVNAAVFLVLVLAMVGLFAIVGGIILAVELWVFPPNLMTNWPSLEDPSVGLVDLVRTAAFIATIGVLTGALAGGLEDRAIVRHLALFLDRP